MEHFAFLGLHGKDREEGDDGCRHTCHYRGAHFAHGGENRVFQCFAAWPYHLACHRVSVVTLYMTHDILHEDDTYVDHHTDGDGDTRQGDDVRLHAT